MFSICAFCLCSLGYTTTATTAQAYLVSDSASFTVGDTVLSLLTYRFGHVHHDIWMPLEATTSVGSETALHFDIKNENGETARGSKSGIVLSSAPVESGWYIAPIGTSTSFTLLTIYKKEATESGHTFHTEVTALPFRFDGVTKLELNPAELTSYRSKSATLR